MMLILTVNNKYTFTKLNLIELLKKKYEGALITLLFSGVFCHVVTN